jgi:hypothetical protein
MSVERAALPVKEFRSCAYPKRDLDEARRNLADGSAEIGKLVAPSKVMRMARRAGQGHALLDCEVKKKFGHLDASRARRDFFFQEFTEESNSASVAVFGPWTVEFEDHPFIVSPHSLAVKISTRAQRLRPRTKDTRRTGRVRTRLPSMCQPIDRARRRMFFVQLYPGAQKSSCP